MNIDVVQKRSWSVLVLLTVLSEMNNFQERLPLALLNILLMALSYVWTIYLILKIRGKNVNKNETSLLAKELGVWGFVWRSFAIQFISGIFFGVLVILILQIKVHPSPTISIASVLFVAVASVPVTWAVFSNNRKQQLLWAFPILSGILR